MASDILKSSLLFIKITATHVCTYLRMLNGMLKFTCSLNFGFTPQFIVLDNILWIFLNFVQLLVISRSLKTVWQKVETYVDNCFRNMISTCMKLPLSATDYMILELKMFMQIFVVFIRIKILCELQCKRTVPII